MGLAFRFSRFALDLQAGLLRDLALGAKAPAAFRFLYTRHLRLFTVKGG
jgi:hypothetical protein